MRATDIHSTPSQVRAVLVVLSEDPDSVRNVLNTYCPEVTLLDADSRAPSEVDGARPGHGLPPLKPTVQNVVKKLITEAMRLSGGHQTRAAGYLGITQQALSLKLKQYPEIAKRYQKHS